MTAADVSNRAVGRGTRSAPNAGPSIDSSRAGAGARLGLGLVLLLFAVAGAWLVRTSSSGSVLSWMGVYFPEDLAELGWHEIATFMWQLRIPIPPVLAFVEIISLKVPYGPVLLHTYSYRAALVLVYILAIVQASTSAARLLAATAVSLLFLYCTTLIHPGNPVLYDVLCPLYFLLFVVSLRAAARAKTGRIQLALPMATGFFLSMAELTRPFLIAVLPFFVVCAALTFKRATRRRQLLAFLVPIVLLSGGWHAHLLWTHGQLTFSNHAGFNLMRAWPQVTAPELVPEEHGAPLKPGRWPNLNTAEHFENSRRLQEAFRYHWKEQPGPSALYALQRVDELLSGQTAVYKRRPESVWFGFYKLMVKITAGWLLVQALVLISQSLRRRSWAWWTHLARQPDHLVLAFAVTCIFFLAVGERLEDARFLVSLLPLFAVLPACRVGRPDRIRGGSKKLFSTTP